MQFKNSGADVFTLNELSLDKALSRTTHLGIGAHQDDLEILAFHGISECYGSKEKWFSGITCTNGSGSPRTGDYADYTDEEMCVVRKEEQRNAASIGRYSAMLQLGYSSKEIKDPESHALAEELKELISLSKPEVIYTHNLADKHDTHIGVTLACIEALRGLPENERPKKVYGCEVWRDLDWLDNTEKIVLPLKGREHLAAALLGVFDSQIAGGKRYDLAAVGRRQANATYFESHGVDEAPQQIVAMDLTPLVLDDSTDPLAYVLSLIDNFKISVETAIRSQLGRN